MIGGAGGAGPFDVDEDRALDALSLAWADEYEISIDDRMWTAHRIGTSDSDVITCSTPDELNQAIRTDWARRSSPQSLPMRSLPPI